jgi:hypothetical protein
MLPVLVFITRLVMADQNSVIGDGISWGKCTQSKVISGNIIWLLFSPVQLFMKCDHGIPPRLLVVNWLSPW